MPFFYSPSIKDQVLVLPEEESRHIVKVLRKKEGDTITIIDGFGGIYDAKITVAHHKKCAFKIISTVYDFKKNSFKLHIAIAPTKNNDRLEWFLEKVTEIGVHEITPILCQHSERKKIKQERLEKVTIAAMKQSHQAFLPQLNELISFNKFIEKVKKTNAIKLIAHCENDLKKTIGTCYTKKEDVIVLIGPEGDFSPSEIALALENNFIPISLGKNRLRTETAGITACNIINYIND